MTDGKKARLRNLMAAHAVATRVPSIERREQTSKAEPLSFAQQGLWFVSQLEGPNPAYNNSIIIRIYGALDVEALNRAIYSVVQRHDSLRMRFVEHDGVPSQFCDDIAKVRLDVQEVVAKDADAIFLEQARHPFDIGTDRLFRVNLYKQSAERFVLVVVMHHIISDAWSVGLFVREMVSFYKAYTGGRDGMLSTLPVTYMDYVHWERDWLDSGVLEHQLGYWRRQLKDLSQMPTLLPDMPDVPLHTNRGGSVEFAVPLPLVEKLKSLSKGHRCSLFVTLLAGLAVVLHRYSSQCDIAIGTGVSNRRSTELEGLIGYFVNTLVLRLGVLPDRSFKVLLKETREVFLQALEHQDAPYHRVIQDLLPQKRTGDSPLFQVIFTFQNVEWQRQIKLPSLTMELDLPSSDAAKFDLSIAIQEGSDGLRGQIEYRSEMFEEATVRGLANHYVRLLHEIVAHPELEIGRYSLLSEAERCTLSDEWSGCKHVQAPGRTIHAIFEDRAREKPDATAVLHLDHSWTYRELNASANQLARHLRQLGVKRDKIVAVCVECGFELAVTLLAVLKAGGAYLPLDPDSPPGRVRELLNDSCTQLLITTSAMYGLVPGNSVQAILVDQILAGTEQIDQNYDSAEQEANVDENALAYVMYTSGSTGEPKGVAVEHKGVTRLVTGAHWIALDATTVTIQHSPAAFDASTFEIWASLLNGGMLVVRHGKSADVASLAEQVAHYKVNTLWLPASVLPVWLDEPKSRDAVLRYLLVGGDVVSPMHVQEVYARDPDVVVINGYGPTENTTFSCCYPVPREAIRAGSLPIGKPIDGSSAYVLDDNMQIQPIGCVGELYVGGAGVARGYLNKLSLTARSFVSNPFSNAPHDRLYKTGDKVRWRSSGDLEFLGRADFQVKIRGYRVEMGEIEFRLMQLPEVKLAAVVVREDALLGRHLIAYVVPTGADVSDRNHFVLECKASLRQSLPEYMVPAAMVVLGELPLTSNGKLDRKALPAPEFRVDSNSLRAPRTPEEEILAGLFAEVLQLERVGIDDNFFDFGGHSLLATSLVSRIRSTLGVELSVRTLFESPTVAGLAQRLPGAQRAKQPLRSRPRPAVIPLSFAQKRLWFLQQMEGPSPTYNIPAAVRLEGRLNRVAMRQALNDVLGRHEILRTVFCQDREGPRQRILEVDEVPEYFVEQEVCEEEVEGKLKQAAGYGFDLEREIPLRVWLLRVEEQQHVLMVVLHHIASDGWSMVPLSRDVSAAYNARCQGEAAQWKALPVQYADYSLWQGERLGEESDEQSSVSRQLGYWREKLAGLPPEMELPRDRVRPMVSSYGGGEVGFQLTAGVHEKLLGVAREQGATLFMVLQAGLAALLTRLGGGTDIVVGSPIAGRSDDALDDLVGFFVNMLVLRTDTSGDPSFEELVGRVREDDLNAYAHQELPFEHLVEELNPERSLNRHPLFQVMLVLQNNARPELELTGLKARLEWSEAAPAKFDLTFNFEEDRRGGEAQGIQGQINYAVDLFERGTVEKLAERLERVLQAVAEDPSQSIGEIEILGGGERQQILEEWNDTGREVRQASLPELFEAQVEKSPDATAVVYEDQQLTYGELNRRANRLAHYLRELGVGPDAKVVICVERGLEMIEALLGVLKAGGAYVPLDPGYPVERLQWMVKDSEPVALLVEPRTKERLSGIRADVAVIDVRNGAAWEEQAESNLDREQIGLTAEQLMYVIYTSGSTGTPKGVMVSHAAVGNFLRSMEEEIGCEADDILLAITTWSFDIAGLEMYLPLTRGACVRVLRREEGRDGARLLEGVQSGVTMMQATPANWRILEEAGWKGSNGLKALCGGEALDADLARRLVSKSGSAWNMYGPTETTIWSLVHKLGDDRERVAIGRPIGNTQVYILDEQGQPVPVGVSGELYIAGVGLARGYLKRPELTAERFVPNPFGEELGSRMYGTGDLGRWRGDGVAEYLGRNDFQVKVRGFRIELGEIEAVLSGHERVAQAVVVAREESPGEKHLVGYVVAREGEQVDAAALRRYVGEKLPEYMVPAAMVVLGELPLTSNGKLDRKALPAPEFRVDSNSLRAPRTPEEEILAGLFAEVLQLERVGIDDNFFDFGGHSLLATSLVSRIRSTLGVELSVRTLFESPTVAGLAQRLPGAQRAKQPLRSRPRPAVIPLSFAQKRLWFLQQMEGPSPTYNIPAAVRLEGRLNRVAMRQALNDVLGRHEILRTVFCQDREGPRQRILEVDEVPEYFVEQEVCEEEVEGKLKQAAGYGFDLEREIPLRVWLLRVEEQQHVLMVVLHHIASDGWSMVPLSRDVSAAYNARCQGEAAQWKALPVQYADYSLWQGERLGEESDEQSSVSRQLGYWREKLAGLPPEMELPRDRVRPMVSSYGGGEVGFQLTAGVHEKLLGVAREQGATLFMVLQAGLAALLTRLGGGTDIVVGSPIAGRSDDALDDLVGFFVNTLVLRTDTSGDPSFEELVGRVREDDLNAYAHQELPFEHLVEELNPERSLNRHPLFQVMLVLQNNARPELELTGLKARLEWSEAAPAKLDLRLNIREDRRGEEAQGIQGQINYAVDLFERGTVEKLAERLERVLQAVAEDPSQSIGEIEILGGGERQQILEEWNDTGREVRQASLPELFEAQVEKSPDATAVVYEDQQLTYGELNRRANQVAHLLIGKGIGPESIVGLALPRSLEMIIGLLGILKAGAAYLPLDPEYPQKRLVFMIEDAGLACLLTVSSVVARLPEKNEKGGTKGEQDDKKMMMSRVVWDSGPIQEELACMNPANPKDRQRVQPLLLSHPAYVIYTSGSTGKPKGVTVTHAGIANLSAAQVERFAITTEARILQFASPSFDASVSEVFTALTTGAALVMPAEGERNGMLLQQLLVNHEVTHATLPPTVALTLPADSKVPLTTLITAGEPCPAELVVRCCNGRRMINAYGPTESTVCATMSDPLQGAVTPPIGRPIWNTQLHVLDRGFKPVPVGVSGELYIAGVGLARGYLKRPELTAERFVPNPFGEELGSRMYGTGDLGRWRGDGVAEYLGRNDFQVKVRGFRIELGEIEAVLSGHERVAQAVVVAREESPGEKHLVGYVVAREGEQVDAAALRRYVGEKLPEYMVPAAMVVLGELPLTSNGKLDRKALPAPEFRVDSNSLRAPRTPEEEILAGLFAEVLQLERVGIDDNFFDFGGHSLLATSLVSRIRSTLGVELSVRTLFESPTVAGLAQRLPGAQRAKQPLRSRPRPAVIPLSFAQKRLWFLQQMEGPSPTYNIPAAVRLEGRLNRVAMRQALNDVLGRHEILRTVFCQDREGPRQRILEVDEVPEYFVEQEVCEEEVEGKLKQAAGYGFDLEREIPLRVWLLRVEEQQHVLMVVLHHIASDGWSMVPLSRDVSAAYNARCQGEAAQWKALPVQYADYSLWQGERLGEESDEQSSVSRQLGYWREKLAGLPPEMELPRDRVRPMVSSYGGGEVGFQLTAGVHEKLLGVAREQGATLFMVLQAGLAALLTRLGGGTDIVVGSPIAGRSDDALDDLVGFFVNMLVLRTDTSGDPSFEELVGRVREDDLNAYAHQELPFEHLVEELNPERSLNRHPLFQVMLVLQNNARPELELTGLKARLEWSEAAPAKFDLTFNFEEDRRGGEAQGIQGQINYAVDLFERGTVEKLAERLERVLQAVAEDPSQSIGEIEILGGGERQQILEEWNDTGREVRQASLPELFEAQVEKSPDATAVVYEDQQLTYGELNRRANRLAHYLRELGVGPDAKVVICVERGLEMIEALLGVLKAGGAYVPLDPGYPVERLQWMVKDSEPVALLVEPRTKERLSGIRADVAVIDVRNGAAWEEQAESNLDREQIGLTAEQLMYVIYTSGSTGTPKGVMVSHAAVGNFLRSMEEEIGCEADDILLAITTWSFDIAGLEMYLPLTRGACVRVLRREEGRDGARLLEGVQSGVTMMQATPANWRILEEAGWKGSNGLKALCGGEALDADLARRLVSKSGSAWNMYGPTETTIWSLVHKLGDDRERVAIGRPIGNTQVYILDEQGQPVPVGVSGELYIAGVGLARGYLKRPELTAERFVPNPFGEELGSRMYGTGDLGRWRGDGVAEYLGRNDFQVKVRGFRIELGEIEAVLSGHERVAQAVVVAREESPGEKHLVGYVVAREGEQVDAAALRRYVGEKLPEYMVPAAMVVLGELPLTSNGKLDRKALPAPEFRVDSNSLRAPRTPEEEILAGLFAEVLQLERVGIDDNFFDFGGHSLLATSLVSRIRSTLGVELSVRTLFESPTVAGLAQRLPGAQRAKQPLRSRPRPAVIPLSFAQKRLWFLQQMEGPSPTYNIPAAVRLEGRLNRVAMRQALNDVLGRHEILRTVFCQDREGPRQRILEVDEVPEYFVEQEVCEEEVEGKLKQAAGYGFDLEREIPLRVWLLRVEEQQHVLMVVLHHIASDGWSMVPLSRDVSAAYNARCQGEAAQWKALPVQYADYSLWQGERLGEESDEQSSVSRQLGYWREKLAGLPPEMELPRDRVRPMVSSYGGGEVGFQLTAGVHEKLLGVAREQGATLFMVLQAGLAALLTRLGGGTDIVVGSPIAGRSDDALDDLVGFFVNTLVLRTDTSGDPSFEELVGRVREDDLNAYAHQELPFEHLVEELNPERSLNRHPLFQVMLVLQNNARPELELTGLKARLEWSEAAPAIFDLTFNFEEDRRGGEAQGIQGQINYAVDLFERGTVEKLAERLERVLQAVAEDPSQSIGEIEILGGGERQQILEEWNDTGREVRQASLPELFEAQVEKSPDATAVVYEDQQLTYGELNRRANRLAHYLRELGVGPDAKVVICVERGLEMIEALLGVLKAGGAYVPLDPGYPVERLQWMVKDSEPVALLTQEHLKELFSGMAATVLVIERGDGSRAWGDRPESDLSRRAIGLSSEHLAYIIYTSGSTGMPKGAMNEHRGVVNRLIWMQDAYELNVDDAVLQKTPFSFDVSVWEFFWTLLVGARLVMARPGGHKDPNYLVETIQQDNITTMHFVPSMLQVFVEQADVVRCSTLVRLICSGEALPATLVRRFQEQVSSCTVHNLYGPTEAAVDVTAWTCPRGIEGDRIPIGRPIANTQIYILDRQGQPVPMGVAGQIHIGGVQVARGYLNRPELTAERFLPDPIVGELGVRMYQTGDIGKWLADGSVEFLGRDDEQVKIRGFRVELGEIEATLAKHSGVREAVVVAREDTVGDKRLVAYYTTGGDLEAKGAGAEELRGFLTARLPEYMVPAAYVRLESLSLTPNGKLDRKRLPVPEGDAYAVRAYEPPQGEVETVLAGIWAELLKVERVGRHDNFFDLGGHSLLIIQLASRLRSAFGVEVPLRAFFDGPTLLGMTHAIAISQLDDENSEEILQELRELSQMSPEEVNNLLTSLRDTAI